MFYALRFFEIKIWNYQEKGWKYLAREFKIFISIKANQLLNINPNQDGSFRDYLRLWWSGEAKRPALHKICYTYPTNRENI